MKKFIVMFVAGIAIGYFYGFADAKANPDNVVQRVVNRVGGANRERVSNDLDAKLEGVEKGRN